MRKPPKQQQKLKIEPPSATCPYCRFTSAVAGEWSVEDGRLVFRAAEDPLPSRGPSLDYCCEGSDCGEFSGIEPSWGDNLTVTDEQFAVLKATATQAREDEMKAWQQREEP